MEVCSLLTFKRPTSLRSRPSEASLQIISAGASLTDHMVLLWRHSETLAVKFVARARVWVDDAPVKRRYCDVILRELVVRAPKAFGTFVHATVFHCWNVLFHFYTLFGVTKELDVNSQGLNLSQECRLLKKVCVKNYTKLIICIMIAQYSQNATKLKFSLS